MLIDLSEFLSVNDKEADIQTDIDMSRFTTKTADYQIVQKKPMMVHIRNTGKKVVSLSTVIDVTLLIPCDRCLEDVRYNMNIVVNKEIDMNESEEERINSLDELNFVKENTLNMDELVHNEILIHLPMKVLCSDNCKGICNRCGANLNSQTCSCDTTELDPRMSRIRDIFNNFKEV